jgi:membrane protease YdiL (CAAX protease family)
MKTLFPGMGILICFGVLLQQFYVASRRGYRSIADVAARGGSLDILNQRHAVSAAAMAALALYVGFTKKEWLLLGASQGVRVGVLTFSLGAAAFTISLAAATQAVLKLKPVGSIAGATETYLFLRALFLFFYEIFFRAVLLSYCIQFTGVPVAIAINVALYVAAHAFSTRQELLGTVPFGILLCLVTLSAKSVWPAVLLHLLLGLPYDVFILSVFKFSTKTYIS